MADDESEASKPVDNTATSAKTPPSKPVPLPRVKQADSNKRHSVHKPQSIENELQYKLSQASARTEHTASNEEIGSKASQEETKPVESNNRPLLHSPRVQPTKTDKPAMRSSIYDNVTHGQTTSSEESAKPAKEVLVLPKPKSSAGTPSSSGSGEPPMPAEPPWKTSLKQRTGE